MSEPSDVDNIDFDFFEEEPPTEEQSRTDRLIRRSAPRGPNGPRRPPRAPQNLTPLLRLVGLIAFAILIIVLLVFWIQSCQASSKTNRYKNYMTKVSEVANSSEQIGRQLSDFLLAPGTKRSELQSQIAGLSRHEQLNVDRARGITPPGPLRDEHQAVIQALEYRVSGLNGLANALGATVAIKNTTKAASALASQMQRFIASDVIWDDSFKSPAEAELKQQGITGTNDQGGPLVSDSNFLQNGDLASISAMTSVLERLRGATTGTTGGLRGTSIVSAKVLPSGQELSTSTQTTIVVTASMSFQVTVQNSGNSQVLSVPVTLTIVQPNGNNIVKHARIQFLNQGDTTTVEFHDIGQPDFSVPTSVKIEVQPVAGETNTDNNSADYPVIFSVAA